MKNPTLQKNGWNHTLARFRARLDAEFDTLQNVRGGQSSGGLVPEKALAKIDKVVKDDLKRSVSAFLLCFGPSFYRFVNLATAAPGFHGRRRKALQERG